MEYEKAKYMYLAKVIKRGFYKNGKPFLPVDFFKYISGYQSGENILKFIQEKLIKYFHESDEVYNVIIDFMIKNNYIRVYTMERDWAHRNLLLSKEKIDTIFDYIEMNGYPTINYVYNYFFRIYGTKELEIKKQNASEDNIIKLSLKKD